MNDNSLKFLHIGDGAARRGIAVRAQAGAAPGLFWLGGYKSDMKGTKAEALADWAAQAGRACVRFDYSGHGEFEGAFTDGTIGRWLADSLAVFDACCEGPQILIGSSMGGWLALLLTRELKRRRPPSLPASGGRVGRIGRRHGSDRAGGGFHRRADVETVHARDQARARGDGRLGAAVAICGGALSGDAAIDRGGPQAPLARRLDRDRLPGAHFARRRGSRRAVAARRRTDLAAGQRRRRAHSGQGRRSPPVAARGYRAA